MDQTAVQPTLTPMMAQYFEIKAVNPGYLLFYRMGDFYELFFEDAEIASAALGIVLTKRGKHLGQDIAMCGVPIHAANDYLNKLIRLGHRVAICEQVEDPKEAKKRGAKSVVKRDVVRLITAGTLTEDDHLDARASNFLAALAMVRHGETDFALAWADVSTGETFTADLAADQLQDELARIDPAELLLTCLPPIGPASPMPPRRKALTARRRQSPCARPCPAEALIPPASRARRGRPWALWLPMCARRKRGWALCCARRLSRAPPATWPSMRRPAPASNCTRPSAASSAVRSAR
jgi:hypothetical protein